MFSQGSWHCVSVFFRNINTVNGNVYSRVTENYEIVYNVRLILHIQTLEVILHNVTSRLKYACVCVGTRMVASLDTCRVHNEVLIPCFPLVLLSLLEALWCAYMACGATQVFTFSLCEFIKTCLCFDGAEEFSSSLGLTLHILFHSTHCSFYHWLISCLNSLQTHRAIAMFINPLELINTMAHIPGI